jgi:hypothetical protein
VDAAASATCSSRGRNHGFAARRFVSVDVHESAELVSLFTFVQSLRRKAEARSAPSPALEEAVIS